MERDNGALEGAAGAFSEDDEIFVQCEIVDSTTYLPLRVMGFTGKPKACEVETVYVLMTVGATLRCFVWDVSSNSYASVNKNDGDPASFPCDPADISEWIERQSNAGADLYSDSICGRRWVLNGSCITGGWGEAGSDSDSVEEPSDCGCGFVNTGECDSVWDFTTKCFWVPILRPELWRWSGSYEHTRTSHVLYNGSIKLVSKNNSGIEDAFKIELLDYFHELRWSADGAACGGQPCDNIRLDSGAYDRTWKFHVPLKDDLLVINKTATKSWDICNNTGAHSQVNVISQHRLNNQALYSEKIITQIFAVEARTVTRSSPGALNIAGWCSGSSCAWTEEVFTTYGLNIAAQVGTFEDTDGVDPTGLSRNSSFESVITGMYDDLRALESVPEDEMANAIIALSILNEN